jgi:hypothetical protein
MPIIPPGRPATAVPRAHLEYLGGPVISNVQVVMVLWGPGRYAPFVTGEASPSIASFFAGVTSSPYLDGLSQYDTSRAAAGGQPGTDQHIGRGTFARQVQIAPSEANDGARIDDANIVAELSAQLAAGALPPPVTDDAGHVDTVYMLYFPAGKTITLGRETSCKTLCAYHGSFRWSGLGVYYAAMPDMSPGSGCDVGCGSGAPFANATAVASHELAEAITDPAVGLAAEVGPPLAWYDPAQGEIGDICNGLAGTILGGDGTEYVVQKLWSNLDAACVVSPGAAPAVALASPAAEGEVATPVSAATPDLSLHLRPELAAVPELRSASVRTAPPELAPPTPGARPSTLASEPSEVPSGSSSRFAIEEENDALGVGSRRTDQFYTQGLRISSRWATGDRLATEGKELLGFAIGQNIYTPSDIRISDLEKLRHDRPYAGWLYAALLWDLLLDHGPPSLRAGEDAAGDGASALGFELALGTTGPRSGAGPVQTNFHRLLRDLSGDPASPPDPAGWSIYQTANRPTADVALRYQFDVAQASAALGEATAWTGSLLSFRVSPRARLDVGSMYDAVGLGLEVRAGLLAAAHRTSRPKLPLELYAFARVDGRYVAYNGFIEGPLRGGVTTLVSIAPRVADLDVGLVSRVGAFELEYAQLWRTNELAGVPPGSRRIHDVGQVRVSFLY